MTGILHLLEQLQHKRKFYHKTIANYIFCFFASLDSPKDCYSAYQYGKHIQQKKVEVFAMKKTANCLSMSFTSLFFFFFHKTLNLITLSLHLSSTFLSNILISFMLSEIGFKCPYDEIHFSQISSYKDSFAINSCYLYFVKKIRNLFKSSIVLLCEIEY